jgi:hypothetical protein
LASDGYYYRHRFNEIETRLDNKGQWTLISDDGPNQILNKTTIKLDDSVGDTITLDKTTKTITIACQEWKVNVVGNAVITVAKDVTLNVKGNVNATVAKDLTVTCANAKVKATKEVSVAASGDVTVKGKSIKLNGSMGNVLTTMSDPILCPITGLPAKGVPTVKAG